VQQAPTPGLETHLQPLIPKRQAQDSRLAGVRTADAPALLLFLFLFRRSAANAIVVGGARYKYNDAYQTRNCSSNVT